MQAKPVLQQNQESKLMDSSQLEVGLSWEMLGEKIDLDLTAVLLTDGGQLIDAVYFKKTLSDDQSVKHSGDERSGKAEGYDEKITILLNKIQETTKVIAILVNSASGQDFQKVESAELSIFNNKEHFVSINCGCQGNFHSILAAFIYKNNENAWIVRNITVTGNQKDFVECLPMITSAMKFLVDEDTLKEIESWNIKLGKSYDLKKGDEIPIPSSLQKIALGLGWETTCDLDSAVMTIDRNFNQLEYIYYGFKNSENGSIQHGGDNLTGAGAGDDETIIINLPKMNTNVEYLACIVNVYTPDKTFSNVTQAFCRLFDWESKREFCKYNLNEYANFKTCLMCYLKKEENKWKVKAFGKFYHSFNRDEILKEIGIDCNKLGEHYEGKPVNQFQQNQKIAGTTQEDCCVLI